MILWRYFGILIFIFSFPHFHTMYSCCLRNDKLRLQKNNCVNGKYYLCQRRSYFLQYQVILLVEIRELSWDAAMSQHINDSCVYLGLKLWINQVHNDCLFGKEWILYLTNNDNGIINFQNQLSFSFNNDIDNSITSVQNKNHKNPHLNKSFNLKKISITPFQGNSFYIMHILEVC